MSVSVLICIAQYSILLKSIAYPTIGWYSEAVVFPSTFLYWEHDFAGNLSVVTVYSSQPQTGAVYHLILLADHRQCLVSAIMHEQC